MLEALNRLLVLGLHIPDGFLSISVSLLFWILTIAAVAVATRITNRGLDDRQVPLMGVMAACIFAAQMLNFPVTVGASGHLVGGALAAIMLGPWASVLVMACVVALQALLFQDGGLIAMGANIFNMGVLTALIGGVTLNGLLRLIGRQRWGLVVASFSAAWLSVMAAALLTSLQLIASGTSAAQVVLPAMLGVHSLIGIGEGLITAAAVSFVLVTRPDILPASVGAALRGERQRIGRGGILASGLAIAAVLALVSPLASGDPDGLERVAERLNFLDLGQDAPYTLIPDYTLPGINGGISTILAGLVGLLIVAALSYGIATLLRRRRTTVS